jgi:MSHA pilin protein MshD
MYDSNFGITATSIASSVIEDASKKRFDNIYYKDSTRVYNVSDFTPAANLGVDSGEVISDPKTFNDFDDYNGYTTVDSTMPSAIFNVTCRVYYVNDTALDDSSNNQTFHKKISVRVSSRSMRDTMVMSSIYSYWNFLP